MKKNILVFGGMAGLILACFIFSLTAFGGHIHNLWVGYASMIIAFSFIYVGIRNFRDKYNQGVVSFGKALRVGLGITLIGATIYVITWLIDFYCFVPDFMDKYSAEMIRQAQASGVSGAALEQKIASIRQMAAWYKNPVFVMLMTYLEVLPVGIVISLIAALILKRKTPSAAFRRTAEIQHA